jgi:membrane protease YdiL (CAAX protease family)
MDVLLTRFLDINLLFLIMFPWARSMISKDPLNKDEFDKYFTSSFIFVFVFMYIMYKHSWNLFFSNIQLIYFLFSSLTSFMCLSCEFIVSKILYGRVVFQKIPKNNIFLLSFLLFIIPVMEEFLFRFFLPYLLIEIFNMPWFFVLLLSGLSFSLNHLPYPHINLITKFIWGIFLMILVFITHNVLFAAIAHVCNNIVIFILEGLKNDKNK